MTNKNYIWLTISTVALGLAFFLIGTGIFFTRGLNKLKDLANQRMVSAAYHSAAYINRSLTAGDSRASEGEIDSWLEQYCLSTGFDRIVVCDSFIQVVWTSSDLFTQGDDFQPFLSDQSLYAEIIDYGHYQFTKAIKIAGHTFKSLYYQCILNGKPYVLILEADQDFFQEAAGFRNTTSIIVLILVMISLALLIFLIILDQKAQKAFARTLHNERLAFLGRTSAELAHELKNPLAIIKSSVDVLREEYDPQNEKKVFTYLSDEIMRLSKLISNILTFSRKKNIAKLPFSPKQELQALLPGFSKMYPDISVTVDLPESLRLVGNNLAFGQIAENLMRNAGNAIQGTGTISIYGESRKKHYFLFFQDNGPGIAKALRKNLFEPFVTESKIGTGLGLALVASLCDSMNWQVSLVSAEKGNTRFALQIKEIIWEKS